MGKDGSEPLIPLNQVIVTKDISSAEYQEYDGTDKPWIVGVPVGENAEKPTMLFDFTSLAGESAPQVTLVYLNADSNVLVVTVTIGDKKYDRLPVSPAGQITFPTSFVLEADKVQIELDEPVDASLGKYVVSPNVQGCFRAETTTIVTPTTTTAGTTTPSTTTVSTVSTTGTVVTTTTPTVTTTLSASTPPSVGTTRVTTAVVTTTTTATETTTVVCPLTGEMPKQTPDLSDKQFTAVTGEGTPTEVRPGVVGWTPTVAKETPPVLQVNLEPSGTTSTPLLQYVTVSDTVATTVTVNVYSTKDTTVPPVFSITVTIPESGTITVFVSPDDKLPIKTSVVEFVLGAPKNPDDTTYDTTITLVGCFEPLAGK